jgi:hypothetical protein
MRMKVILVVIGLILLGIIAPGFYPAIFGAGKDVGSSCATAGQSIMNDAKNAPKLDLNPNK